MAKLIEMINNELLFYLLAFIRVTSLFLLSPIFGMKNIPGKLKVGFSLVLTILIVPMFQDAAAASTLPTIQDIPTLTLVVKIAKEMMVGLMLGWVSILFLNLSQIAGQVIDVSMGLGVGSVFDPQMNTQSPITGTLLNTTMFLYFITANGHLRLIKILYHTFSAAPVGQVQLSVGLMKLAVDQFYLIFSLAVSLMLPVIAVTLIIETAMGILTRAVPQLNAYLVGIPVKVLAGLTVLFMLQPVYITFCDGLFDKLFRVSEQVTTGMGGIL